MAGQGGSGRRRRWRLSLSLSGRGASIPHDLISNILMKRNTLNMIEDVLNVYFLFLELPA